MMSGKSKRISRQGNLSLLFIIFVVFFSGNAYAQLDCSKCHKYIANKKVVHAAIQMGCEACHTEPHQKQSKFPKGLSSAMPDLCYGCHDKTKFSKKSVHPPVAGGMCSGCHDPHTSDNPKLLNAASPDLCFTCHDKKGFSGKKVAHAPVMAGMCPSCHTPHSSDSDKLLVSAQPGLCYTCHDKKKFENKIIHAPVSSGMCTSCHFPHQGDTEKLLMGSQPDMCYNCHDKSGFEKKNVHAAVMMGCTSCHNPHAGKTKFLFDRGVNNVCIKCHADIIKKGHVAPGHPLKAKVDPARKGVVFSCSSCHEPHSSDTMKLFKYSANTRWELCKNCHKKNY